VGSTRRFVVRALPSAAKAGSVALRDVGLKAAGAEIDLLLEIPGCGLWAIEVKRSLSGRPEKCSYIACRDLKSDQRFVVNAGLEQYPIDVDTIAIGAPGLPHRLPPYRFDPIASLLEGRRCTLAQRSCIANAGSAKGFATPGARAGKHTPPHPRSEPKSSQ